MEVSWWVESRTLSWRRALLKFELLRHVRDDYRVQTRVEDVRSEGSRRSRLGIGVGKSCSLPPPRGGLQYDATARDGKPNPLNEREAKAELWGRGLPVQRGTALENDDVGGGSGGLGREGRVRARLNSTGGFGGKQSSWTASNYDVPFEPLRTIFELAGAGPELA